MDFQHNGNTYDEMDLLPLGNRVSPEAIAAGLMKEIAVNLNGEERHLPLITVAGMTKLKEEFDLNADSQCAAPWAASDETPASFIIVDDTGMPTGTVNVNQIQDDAMELAFALAATCGNATKTEQILAEHIQRHTTHGLSMVLVAAIKHMTNDILAGAFDVMEAATGTKPREKMAEIGGMSTQGPSA